MGEFLHWKKITKLHEYPRTQAASRAKLLDGCFTLIQRTLKTFHSRNGIIILKRSRTRSRLCKCGDLSPVEVNIIYALNHITYFSCWGLNVSPCKQKIAYVFISQFYCCTNCKTELLVGPLGAILLLHVVTMLFLYTSV